MKKKVIILLTAIILLFNFVSHEPVKAEVITKAGTLAGKKVLKELVVDAAVEVGTNYALQEAMAIVNDYTTQDGFKMVCVDKKPTCDNPIQVKETLTASDKDRLSSQAEIELDKLVSPGGKGFSKFQNFLDWFLPIWIVSFAFTAITYALDGDFRDLLNEAAYNALVAIGFIIPGSKIATGEDSEPELIDPVAGSYTDNDNVVRNRYSNVFTFTQNDSLSSYLAVNGGNWYPMRNAVIITKFQYQNENVGNFTYFMNTNGDDAKQFGFSNDRLYLGTTGDGGYATTVVEINGKTAFNGKANYDQGYYVLQEDVPGLESILKKKMDSIKFRAPYQLGEFMYTDTLFNTVEGDVIKAQVKQTPNGNSGQFTLARSNVYANNMEPTTVTQTVYLNVSPVKQILVPNFDTMKENGFDPIESTGRSSDNGNVALLPPAALTYENEQTGEEVIRKANPVPGGNPVFETPTGEPVPEENVVPKDPPDVVKKPGENPTYTPSPTPSNPSPEPVPLTPAPTPSTPTDPHPGTSPNPDPNPDPGTNPDPGGGTENPTDPPATETPVPDGPSCDEGLKFPRAIPFMNTLSNAFPFSIPWDIERALNAAFGGIDGKRPAFELPVNFNGEEHVFKIGVPKFFDNYKPFTDGLLLLIFDVGIMFGIYHFMKGGGS